MRRDEPIVIYSVVPGEPHSQLIRSQATVTDAPTGQDSILICTPTSHDVRELGPSSGRVSALECRNTLKSDKIE
ncbi:hypothetical protein CHU98_g3392 [Xylaria longipes]|nr:hypothetical protein CHU98_g3392 [Xylaria longipes]